MTWLWMVAWMVQAFAQDGGWYYIDSTGATVNELPPEPTDRMVFEQGLGVYTVDEKSGLMNERGEKLTEPVYDALQILSNGLVAAYADDGAHLLDASGAEVATSGKVDRIWMGSECDFQVGLERAGLMEVRVGEDESARIGLMDRKGQLVVPPEFLCAGPSGMAGLYFVEEKPKKWRLYQQDTGPFGESFAMMGPFSEGLAPVGKKDGWHWGFIDPQGEIVIPMIYLFRSSFRGDYAYVTNQAREDLAIDKEGAERPRAEAPQPEPPPDAGPLRHGRRATFRDGKWGFEDADGVVVVPHTFDMVRDFRIPEATVVKRDGKHAVMGRDGEVLTSLDYYMYDFFDNGTVAASLGGREGLLDRHGHVIFPFVYPDVGMPNEGLVPVLGANLWGYADMSGALVIAPQFGDAGPFQNGVARVRSLEAKQADSLQALAGAELARIRAEEEAQVTALLSGLQTDPNACPKCAGRGTVPTDATRCSACGGAGTTQCGSCNGGYTYNARGESQYCQWCQGSGQRTCRVCAGSGSRDGASVICDACQGTGRKPSNSP